MPWELELTGKAPKRHISGSLAFMTAIRYSNDATQWHTKEMYRRAQMYKIP